MIKCLIIIMANTQKQTKFKCFPGRLKKIWQLWMFSQQELKYLCLLFGFSATVMNTFNALDNISKQQLSSECREAELHCAGYSQLCCHLNQWQEHDLPFSVYQCENTVVAWEFWDLFLAAALRDSFAVGLQHFSLPICKMGIINYTLHNSHGT